MSLWPLTLLGSGRVLFFCFSDTWSARNNLTQGSLECPLTSLSGLTHLRPAVCCFVTNWIELDEKLGSEALCVGRSISYTVTHSGRVCVWSTTATDNMAKRCMSAWQRYVRVCVSLNGGHGVIYAFKLNKMLDTACSASAVCLLTKKYNHCTMSQTHCKQLNPTFVCGPLSFLCKGHCGLDCTILFSQSNTKGPFCTKLRNRPLNAV